MSEDVGGYLAVSKTKTSGNVVSCIRLASLLHARYEMIPYPRRHFGASLTETENAKEKLK